MLFGSYECTVNCRTFENNNSELSLLHLELNQTLDTNPVGDAHQQFPEHVANERCRLNVYERARYPVCVLTAMLYRRNMLCVVAPCSCRMSC
jgi:hypothetical protein